MDTEERFIGVEVIIEGKKTLLIGIYAPNGAKEKNGTKAEFGTRII